MTSVDSILLSRFYQISKVCVLQLEYCLPKIKNDKLQTIISNHASNFEVLSNECFALAKAQRITLPDNLFFRRCKALIEQSLDEFNSIELPTIIMGLTISNIHTLIELYNVEKADSETISIGKHLQEILENQLNILKQIKL